MKGFNNWNWLQQISNKIFVFVKYLEKIVMDGSANDKKGFKMNEKSAVYIDI